MDTLHRFTFFSGHDRHQLSGRLFHILIEENVIILMRLCIFPPRTLEPLGHRLRRDVAPVDKPLAQRVERRRRDKHEHRAGQPLFKVIDDGKLLAVMNVPVSAPRTIGTELSFRFAGHPDVVKGKVFEVSPRADHRSGTIEIKALIDNSDGKLTAWLTGVLTDGE